MASEAHQETGIRSSKRQKIDIACDTCRARKVKCDGVRPICGVCLKRKDRGINCRWSAERPKVIRNSIASTTIEKSPNRPASVSHDHSISDNHQVFDQLSGQGPQDHSPLHPLLDSHQYSENIIPVISRDTGGSTQHEETPHQSPSGGVDSMTGAIDASSYGFFGSSSASSFMKQIKSAVDAKFMPPGGADHDGRRYGPILFAPPLPASTRSQDGDGVDYVLPPRRIADSLILVYWELVHPLYPFLDRQSFEEACTCIWSGAQMQQDERLFMCTLNCIFALSCQLTESIKVEDRASSAAIYFKRAQGLLQMSLWEPGSIELIQCLLIMGQYLQSTNTPHQCWMVVGHAIRVAQGLGLHLLECNRTFVTQRKREIARRIWHGCVLMDRVLSMTLGRPTIVSKSFSCTVPLPANIDDNLLSDELGICASQPHDIPSTSTFFIKSLQLHDIINDILVTLYFGEDSERHKSSTNLPSPQSQFGDIAKVIQLDRALMNWGQSLPLHLRISASESFSNSTFLRQAIISRIRFLHTRILLFRPILSQFCLPQIAPTDAGTVLDESLTQRMVLQCSNLCLRAAHDLISIVRVHFIKKDMTGVLPAWWYNIFYVYTAATCLLAARLRPVIQHDIAHYTVAQSWNDAIEILKSLECFGESAQRCVTALEILSSKFPMVSEASDQHLSPAMPELSSGAGGSASDVDHVSFAGFGRRSDLSIFNFDPNDMSWINSVPGNF
ncbi:fungal-specific transcription factor domain-containing protein [Bisporella sp. PMI_857]|nr:fungal-specific transcription factor domain-containing protein [Bisporella sp. PMI_857]